jgi:hypothetical protein
VIITVAESRPGFFGILAVFDAKAHGRSGAMGMQISPSMPASHRFPSSSKSTALRWGIIMPVEPGFGRI